MIRFIIGFLVGGLVCLVCITGFVGFVTLVLPEERKEILVLPQEIEEIFGKVREIEIVGKLRERITGIEQPEWEFPTGDTTPEHLAQVLGSKEYYEKLRDSKLRRTEFPMMIMNKGVYDVDPRDPTGPGQLIVQYPWVYMVLRGEVIRIEERTITLISNGETISLHIPEWASVETDEKERFIIDGKEFWAYVEADFEDIKIGDRLDYIAVTMQAGYQPRVGLIRISTIELPVEK